jgi:excisionase family DNA binding protein
MNPRARMTVEEIASLLDVGRLAVYAMLEQGLLPGIRIGRRWIVTRAAFEAWEKTCGTRADTPTGTGLQPKHEVTVN